MAPAAVLSGLAGVYATITRKGETIVGVAIATALMPPLAVVGFGTALGNWDIARGAAFLFMTNLLAIALSVTIVARWYGFGGDDTPKQSAWQALLIVGIRAAVDPAGPGAQADRASVANRTLCVHPWASSSPASTTPAPMRGSSRCTARCRRMASRSARWIAAAAANPWSSCACRRLEGSDGGRAGGRLGGTGGEVDARQRLAGRQ